jgi:hypothetical protein
MKPILPHPLLNHSNITGTSPHPGFFIPTEKKYSENPGTKWNKTHKTITTKSLCIYRDIITANFVRKHEHFVPKTIRFVPKTLHSPITLLTY